MIGNNPISAVLVSTDLGLARWVNNKWDVIDKDRGLVTDLITTVFQDREGSLWVGTEPMAALPMKDRDIFDLLGFD